MIANNLNLTCTICIFSFMLLEGIFYYVYSNKVRIKGINLLCAAKEYDQIYWVMYSGQSFKFKGLCVVVHPINWVMYSNPALKIIGLFVVVHPINWDTSHTIQYIRIHHRQSNILGYIRGNPLFADNPIHWNALENDPILCDILDTIQ